MIEYGIVDYSNMFGERVIELFNHSFFCVLVVINQLNKIFIVKKNN